MADEPAPSQRTAHLERMSEASLARLRSARAEFTVSTHRTEALRNLITASASPQPACAVSTNRAEAMSTPSTIKPEQTHPPRPEKVRRSSPPEETEKVEWAFSGDRYHRNAESSFWGHRIDVFDGDHLHTFQECTIPGFRTSPQGSVTARPLQFPGPLDFGYTIEGRWIFDILKCGETVIKEREQDPVFGNVLAVQSVQKNGDDYRFWFAPDRGYLAVRAECEQHNTGDPGRWQVTRIRCDRAIEDNGVWFPMSGASEGFQVLSTDVEHPILLIRREYSATSAQVNHVPEDLFEMRFPAGTIVWDAVEHKRYYIDASSASV